MNCIEISVLLTFRKAQHLAAAAGDEDEGGLAAAIIAAALIFPWSRLPVLISPWPRHLHRSSRLPGKKEVLSLLAIKYSIFQVWNFFRSVNSLI